MYTYTINKLMLPEILTAALAGFILLWDAFIMRKLRITSYWLSQLGLIVIIGSICYNFKYLAQNIYLFNNSILLNFHINFFKLIISIFMLVILIYAKHYIKAKNYFCGEYFVLSLITMFGMMILISSANFLNFYLGLETISLPIYGLISLESKHNNLEAAVKYFVVNAIFSGVLLYGLSLIYGATGTLDFNDINNFIQTQHLTLLFNVGLLLLIIAILFKLNIVPLHMWVIDVFQGSASPVGMLIATLPKIVTVVILGRMVKEIFFDLISNHWQLLLIAAALLSLIIGNIGAILQDNIKRLLAYSAIGHSGFILLGFVTNISTGIAAANFYTVSYTLMTIGLFSLILIFSSAGFELDDIYKLRILYHKHPWLSAMMLLLLWSLAGIPPSLGFYSKFLIIKALIATNLTWLAIVALVFSVIGLFYYIRIIKAIFFIETTDELIINTNYNLNLSANHCWLMILMLSVNGLAAIGLGIFPIFVSHMLYCFGA